MTLAVIVLSASIVVSPAQAAALAFHAPQSAAPSPTSGGAVTQDQSIQNQASQNQANQNQGTSQPQNQPAPSQTSPTKTTKPQSSSTQKKSSPASAKKPSTASTANKNENARVEAVNCNASAAGTPAAENKKSSTDSAPSTSARPPQASAPAAAGAAHASTTTSNCPPQKVIVPEGSTPEPSIQLAGGPADPPARDNAKQLLQSTEDNLKKIEGHQLTSNQRDMVTQIRQFVAQSKKATEDGDVESARTLAWKAQTLSQELVTPENK